MKETKRKKEENGAISSPAPLPTLQRGPTRDDISELTVKQAKEALAIVTGVSKANPTSEKVRAFVLSQAPRAAERMTELMNQTDNATVAYNATKDILDRSGIVSHPTSIDDEKHFIGEDEAILILRRRFSS